LATTRPSIHGAFAELQRRQTTELRQRQQADGILSPEQIGARTGISTARLLQTTLGGQRRAITADDLKVFKARAKELGRQYREGLTARDIIDQSAPADRERARDQIGAAIPTRLTAGAALFTTPAGPNSKVTRHMVSVMWPGYGSAVSWPGTPLQAAKVLAEQPLKFDCDCEHHRYRFRYITTALGANAGRAEPGFPKITNPYLTGVACKHVLRVMVSLETVGVRSQLAQMIKADRERLERPGARSRVVTTTSAQADRLVNAKPKMIRTTGERERLQAINAIRKAMPKASGDVSADIAKTLNTLQGRQDVTAQALLAALNTVLNSGART
jgi:hypothetical protein